MAHGHSLKNMFLTEENYSGFHRNTVADKAEEHTSKNENTAIPSGVYLVLALFHALLAGPVLLYPSAHSAKVNISISPCSLPPASLLHRGEVYTITWVRPPPTSPRHHSITDPHIPLSGVSPVSLLFPSLGTTSFSFSRAGKQRLSFPFPLLAYVLFIDAFFLDLKSRIQTCKNIKHNGSK